MGLQIKVKRKDYPSFRAYLGEQEYRLLKEVIAGMIGRGGIPRRNLLDLACWDGESTRYYGDRLGINDLHGIDFFEEQIAIAQSRGIKVVKCDLEAEPFPFTDASFDVVVANQIFEHLKQIYRPLSEIHRILKPGGHLVFSVPNLAALHCRLQLLFGIQPSTIKLFDAHVRGFAPSATREFLTLNGLFEIIEARGSGFYPFPPLLSRRVANLFPGFAVYQLYLLRKTDINGKTWQQEIEEKTLQTTY